MRPVRAANLTSLKPQDIVTVYHGTRLAHVFDLINGFDATKIHFRQYGGPKHRGLFVTPDFNTAYRFASRGEIVLELLVRAKNLHGVDYSGTIGRQWGYDAKAWAAEKFPTSFRPTLSQSLTQNVEPQALLVGLVSPKQIKKVWYEPPGQPGQWYPRQTFVNLGIQAIPAREEPYGRSETIRDLGIDLSYPNLSYDQFLASLAKVTGVSVERAKATLRRLADRDARNGTNDLETLLQNVGFEPVAARSYARRYRNQLATTRVAARIIKGYCGARPRPAGARPSPKPATRPAFAPQGPRPSTRNG